MYAVVCHMKVLLVSLPPCLVFVFDKVSFCFISQLNPPSLSKGTRRIWLTISWLGNVYSPREAVLSGCCQVRHYFLCNSQQYSTENCWHHLRRQQYPYFLRSEWDNFSLFPYTWPLPYRVNHIMVTHATYKCAVFQNIFVSVRQYMVNQCLWGESNSKELVKVMHIVNKSWLGACRLGTI